MNLYTNEIIEHAQKDEKNMRIAILAGLAFADLRKKIIDEFANEVKSTLKNIGWSECDVTDWKNSGWAKFRKGDWPANMYVGVCPEGDFKRTILGVIAHDKFVKDETRLEVFNVLKSNKRYGSSGNYCAWWSYLNEKDASYANLNSAEGLINISKFNRQDSLKDLVEKIESIGVILDSIFPKNKYPA